MSVAGSIPRSEGGAFDWSDFLWSRRNAAGTRGVVFAPHPQLVLLNRDGVSLVVSSGVLLILGLMATAVTFLSAFREVLVDNGVISYAPSFIDGGSGWLLGWSFALAISLAGLIHEAGHWIGYKLTGRRLVLLAVGARMSVTGDRGPSNSYQRLLISAAGGLLEALGGACLLATQGGFGWNGLQLIAAAVIFDGVANVILPVRRGSDGWKVWSSILAILIGRGGRSLNR